MNSRKPYTAILAVFLFFVFWKIYMPSSRSSSPAYARQKHLKIFSTCPAHATVSRFKTSKAHRIANFLEGPGLAQWHDDSVAEATCKFRKTSHHSEQHLPHAMQQLYRCFSWWHANPKKRPVLLSPPVTNNPFVTGFISMLQEVIHLKLVHERQGRKAVRPIVDYSLYDHNTGNNNSRDGGFKMRSPGDFDQLRKDMKLFYKDSASHAAGCPPPAARRHDGTKLPMPLPIVTILNRNEGERHLLHAAELQQALFKEFPGVTIKLVDSSMEDKDFTQQLNVMQTTDILMSPHGAQLTSIPFLPTCAHVLEIFPAGSVTPKFYGSLAASAGHAYWVVGDLDESSSSSSPQQQQQQTFVEARQQARAQDVCLSAATVKEQLVPALQQAIKEWQQCCGHRIWD